MTPRQEKILTQIIELNIRLAKAVGSKTLIKNYELNISSATIRNEMAALEKMGFLEKAHTSSGRIPSQKGYDFYARQAITPNNRFLEAKLKDIFAQRRSSIDFALDEAARTITDIVGLTLVTSNNRSDEVMKSIQLTPINYEMATIVIVTSAGRVESKVIKLNHLVKINDVRIAVRLFKERLINTRLIDLAKKVESLSPILSMSIKNYESLIQEFVKRVFDFHREIANKVYGNKNIIKSSIKREDLANLIEMMQNKSIFSSIEGKLDEDKKIKIDIRPDNTSILSTRIVHHNKTTEISVVGSNQMNYHEAKNALKLLKKFLKNE